MLAFLLLAFLTFPQALSSADCDCEISGMTLTSPEYMCQHLCSEEVVRQPGTADPSEIRETVLTHIIKSYEDIGLLDTEAECIVSESVQGSPRIRVLVTEKGPKYRIRTFKVRTDEEEPLILDPFAVDDFLIKPGQEYSWSRIAVSAWRLKKAFGYYGFEIHYTKAATPGMVDVQIYLKGKKPDTLM